MAEQRTKRRGKRAADNQTRLRDRENRALAMHAYGGATLQAIADKFAQEGDPCTESAVSKMITRALDRATFEGARAMRQVEKMRLELAGQRTMQILTAVDTVPELRLKAAATYAKISAQLSKLFGLYAPEVVQLEVSLNKMLDAVRQVVSDEEFERIAGILAEASREGAAREEPGTPAAPASSLSN